MSITFSSCFYIINSKNKPEKYIEWMNNFISIVNNFNLVIYTDENSSLHINRNNNKNVKIIIKPINEFYNYKYKTKWINNHENNSLLNKITSWELNMLWSEKISFVKQTKDNFYFDTEYYGWCDIGYFRNRINDTHTNILMNWPDHNKIKTIVKDKILYGCVNNNDDYMNYLYNCVKNNQEIPPNQLSFAGGFFIAYKTKIDWWFKTFDQTLIRYFENDMLVKDDQIIIANCIFNNVSDFIHVRENSSQYDNWFMFQRILNNPKITI